MPRETRMAPWSGCSEAVERSQWSLHQWGFGVAWFWFNFKRTRWIDYEYTIIDQLTSWSQTERPSLELGREKHLPLSQAKGQEKQHSSHHHSTPGPRNQGPNSCRCHSNSTSSSVWLFCKTDSPSTLESWRMLCLSSWVQSTQGEGHGCGELRAIPPGWTVCGNSWKQGYSISYIIYTPNKAQKRGDKLIQLIIQHSNHLIVWTHQQISLFSRTQLL